VGDTSNSSPKLAMLVTHPLCGARKQLTPLVGTQFTHPLSRGRG
jgi:hypothetical protein